MTLLKIATALSVLVLSGCVVLPLPLYHRAHGYHAAPPAYSGGDYRYAPRQRGPRQRW